MPFSSLIYRAIILLFDLNALVSPPIRPFPSTSSVFPATRAVRAAAGDLVERGQLCVRGAVVGVGGQAADATGADNQASGGRHAHAAAALRLELLLYRNRDDRRAP